MIERDDNNQDRGQQGPYFNKRDRDPQGPYFARVSVWARVMGNPREIARFTGGPWEKRADSLGERAARAIGYSGSATREGSVKAPGRSIEELGARVWLNLDMDLYARSDEDEGMIGMAEGWRLQLQSEFGGEFVWMKKPMMEATLAWDELTAKSERARLLEQTEGAAHAARARAPRV